MTSDNSETTNDVRQADCRTCKTTDEYIAYVNNGTYKFGVKWKWVLAIIIIIRDNSDLYSLADQLLRVFS